MSLNKMQLSQYNQHLNIKNVTNKSENIYNTEWEEFHSKNLYLNFINIKSFKA